MFIFFLSEEKNYIVKYLIKFKLNILKNFQKNFLPIVTPPPRNFKRSLRSFYYNHRRLKVSRKRKIVLYCSGNKISTKLNNSLQLRSSRENYGQISSPVIIFVRVYLHYLRILKCSIYTIYRFYLNKIILIHKLLLSLLNKFTIEKYL